MTSPLALVRALRFDHQDTDDLRALSESQWRQLLDLADQERVTLALGLLCRSVLPESIARRIDQNFLDNSERLQRTLVAYNRIALALQSAGIEFGVLKGFSHSEKYVDDQRHRPQYDFDLFFRRDQVHQAQAVLTQLGYEPTKGLDSLPLDHLPPMLLKSEWSWRGDYFDVEMPLAVELHFQLWDADTERIAADEIDRFWERRSQRSAHGITFTALDPVDTIAYAALHLMRHILRGDFRLYHAYEIAHFLESTHTGSAFWDRWHETHSESVRTLQTIAFRMVGEWFGCRLAPAVQQEIETLPEPIQRWFYLFGMAPLEGKLHPNKNELWLHWALLQSWRDKRMVATRRFLPVRGTGAVVRQASSPQRSNRILARIQHHTRSTAPTLASGLRWWWAGKGIDTQFFLFLASASLFNFGMSIFFLLYNLFLLERGFHEDFLGMAASAMGLGSIAGTIPAAFALNRFGLRNTLAATFLAVPLVCAIRATALSPAPLIVAAFTGGLLFAFYAVSLAPTVSGLTSERSRPFGFSLIFSFGIGIGALAGLTIGRLPSLPLQPTLLIACAIAAGGALPALRLRLTGTAPKTQRVYPSNPFVYHFLFALCIWAFATGLFNPFFSAYFAQALRIPVSQIGLFFSASQVVQVFAVLCAPLVIRRFGPIGGVMAMQLATAIMLAMFALGPAGYLAGGAYAAYMGFQYMSEPGMYSLLMGRVAPAERSGASALNFLVMSGTQAVAAAIAGFGVRRFGYSIVLAIAALMAVLAGLVFRSLGWNRVPAYSAPPSKLTNADAGV